MNSTLDFFSAPLVKIALGWSFTLLLLLHFKLFYTLYSGQFEWNELGYKTNFSCIFWSVYIIDNSILGVYEFVRFLIILDKSCPNNYPNGLPGATYKLDLFSAVFVGLYCLVPYGFAHRILLYHRTDDAKKPGYCEKIIWISLFGFYVLVFSPFTPLPLIFSHWVEVVGLLLLMGCLFLNLIICRCIYVEDDITKWNIWDNEPTSKEIL